MQVDLSIIVEAKQNNASLWQTNEWQEQ